jgi:hypothetical protein
MFRQREKCSKSNDLVLIMSLTISSFARKSFPSLDSTMLDIWYFLVYLFLSFSVLVMISPDLKCFSFKE